MFAFVRSFGRAAGCGSRPCAPAKSRSPGWLPCWLPAVRVLISRHRLLAGPGMGLRRERHRAETLPVRQHAEHLGAQQRESLERDGYLLVPSLLDETVLGRITSRLEELVSRTVAAWAAEPGLGAC